jgi:hypothetical protein
MVVGSWVVGSWVVGSWEMVVDGGESVFNAEKAEAQEAQRGEGGVVEESAMLNSANCSNLLSYTSHASHTSQGHNFLAVDPVGTATVCCTVLSSYIAGDGGRRT